MRGTEPAGSSTSVPSNRDALRYLWRLVVLARPYWNGVLTGVLVGIPLGLIGMIAPYLSKLFIDEVYPARDVKFMHLLVVGLFVISLSTAAMNTVRGYFSQVINARLGSATTLMYFNHLQHLPVGFYDKRRVGEVMSRFGDLRSSVGSIAGILETLLSGGVYLIVVPPCLLLMNWRLAMLCLLTVPVTTTISVLSARIKRKFIKQSAEVSAEFSAFQVEVLSNVRTLKGLAAESSIFARAKEQMLQVLHLQLKTAGIGSLIGLVNGVFRMLGTALYTWVAWRMIIAGELTLGSFIAFSAYVGFLTGPVSRIAGLLSGFQQTAVTLGRAFEYLDERPEQDPALAYQPAVMAPRSHGQLSVHKVSFGYGAGPLVLEAISIGFRPGYPTAVVGASGAGKSSLVRLLGRMVEPISGRIEIDGVRIDTMPLAAVRQQVAVVSQEVALLRGTVWDNLTFGIPHPDRSVVEAAVRICRLERFIKELPEGFETPVAEWGATLSGGQRQRLTVARALVLDRPILLLDEATSQVDVATECEILDDLLASASGKTIVYVTHRVAAARLAKQVCVIERGRVVGLGTHTELLGTCDEYRRLLDAGAYSAARPLGQVAS